MVTKVLGPMSLRMGFVVRREQDNDNDSGLARPNYAFQGLWDLANDAPLYEGIGANPNTGGVGNVQRYFRRSYYAGFVQDDWKVKPNATINVGLRYEFYGGLTNKGFPINDMVLGTGAGTEIINSRLALTKHAVSGDARCDCAEVWVCVAAAVGAAERKDGGTWRGGRELRQPGRGADFAGV